MSIKTTSRAMTPQIHVESSNSLSKKEPSSGSSVASLQAGEQSEGARALTGGLEKGASSSSTTLNSKGFVDFLAVAVNPSASLKSLGGSRANKLEVVPPHFDTHDVIVSPRPEKSNRLPEGAVVKDGFVIQKAVVASNYDGETLKLVDGTSVRVLNADTPERRPFEEWSKEAKEFTASQVLEKEVTLRYSAANSNDHYGRIAAQVIMPNGQDLAEALTERGLAYNFIVDEANNPADVDALMAAQKRAKEAGVGIWSMSDKYQGTLDVSSFHANGRGRDSDEPNLEYFRMINITGEPQSLKGYTVTNLAGESRELPDMTLQPGRTLRVHSGVGEPDTAEGAAAEAYLGSEDPFWNNKKDCLTIRDAEGNIVLERHHEPKKKQDIQRIKNPMSQKKLARLGQDFGATWEFPEKFTVGKKLIVDDGDTLFMKSPETGVFKATVTEDESGQSITRDIQVADQKESPNGWTAIRMVGLDTPETHLEHKVDGEAKFFSQGPAAEIAAEALYELIADADSAVVVPNKARPFGPYGRLLAEVEVTMPDGSVINANEWMVEQGYAEMLIAYNGKENFDLERFERYSDASRNAVTNELGIYGQGEGRCEERPVDFRRRIRNKNTPPPFVIDAESKVVYNGKDTDKVEPYNRLFVFRSLLNEAIEELGLTKDANFSA